MDFTHLLYFITVVKEGSISKAAKSLNMTQPPLSIQIKKLEESLGLTLFERKGKRLILTDSGELLYKHAKKLLASHSQMLEELNEKKSGLRGTIRIGASNAANIIIIPDVVKKLKKNAPNIKIQVIESNSNYILNKLRAHELDICFFREEIEVSNIEDLNIHNILTESLLLALPPDHHLLNKKTVKLTDLKDESFLLPRPTLGYNMSEKIIELCNKAGFSPNVTYWGLNALPMLLLVSKGIGITFVPEYFRYLNWAQLPPLISFNDPTMISELKLVTVKDKYETTITKKFIETTLEVVEELQKSN